MERLGVTSASETTALHLAAALISQSHPPGAHSTALPAVALPSASEAATTHAAATAAACACGRLFPANSLAFSTRATPCQPQDKAVYEERHDKSAKQPQAP